MGETCSRTKPMGKAGKVEVSDTTMMPWKTGTDNKKRKNIFRKIGEVKNNKDEFK
ncbi:MAG: hypothetical protein ACR2KX_08280 [Chitinophagaceae bacterium]